MATQWADLGLRKARPANLEAHRLTPELIILECRGQEWGQEGLVARTCQVRADLEWDQPTFRYLQVNITPCTSYLFDNLLSGT